MAARTRRVLPDNLDPLVDTLANVVGILVIVIVLTQIELGGALDRVADLEERREESEASHAESLPQAEASLDRRVAALQARTEVDLEASIALARRVLEDLEALPTPAQDPEEGDSARRMQELDETRKALAAAREESERRGRYATSLQKVPPRMVARLPDPEVVRGLESWVLVRFGRVYPIDREKLFDEGADAIRRILPNGTNRRVRIDEFESVSHYLRKRPIGVGNLRWQLRTEPSIRVELEWASKAGGLDRAGLAQDPEWRAWLAARDPERDFIRFHVWNDSFETYLAARQAVESAGFRAGWEGYESDQEMELNLRFGAPLPRERAIEVD